MRDVLYLMMISTSLLSLVFMIYLWVVLRQRVAQLKALHQKLAELISKVDEQAVAQDNTVASERAPTDR